MERKNEQSDPATIAILGMKIQFDSDQPVVMDGQHLSGVQHEVCIFQAEPLRRHFVKSVDTQSHEHLGYSVEFT